MQHWQKFIQTIGYHVSKNINQQKHLFPREYLGPRLFFWPYMSVMKQMV